MPLPDPVTRKEIYLNAAASGSAATLPDPVTREEIYLKAIAENSGGGGGGGGSTTLAGLTDVDISNPSDGQTLVYNATTRKWENGSGGSGGGVLALHINAQTGTLDKTWKEIYDQANAGAYCFVLDSFNYDGRTGLGLYQVTSIEDQTSIGNGYKVICSFASLSLSAQTQNDYPSVPMG